MEQKQCHAIGVVHVPISWTHLPLWTCWNVILTSWRSLVSCVSAWHKNSQSTLIFLFRVFCVSDWQTTHTWVQWGQPVVAPLMNQVEELTYCSAFGVHSWGTQRIHEEQIDLSLGTRHEHLVFTCCWQVNGPPLQDFVCCLLIFPWHLTSLSWWMRQESSFNEPWGVLVTLLKSKIADAGWGASSWQSLLLRELCAKPSHWWQKWNSPWWVVNPANDQPTSENKHAKLARCWVARPVAFWAVQDLSIGNHVTGFKAHARGLVWY